MNSYTFLIFFVGAASWRWVAKYYTSDQTLLCKYLLHAFSSKMELELWLLSEIISKLQAKKEKKKKQMNE